MISWADPPILSVKRTPDADADVRIAACRYASEVGTGWPQGRATFLIPIDGRAVWETGNRRYSVSTDTVVHLAEGTPLRQQGGSSRPMAFYVIHYRPDVLRPDFDQELFESPVLLNPGADRLCRLRVLAQEMMAEQASQRLGWGAMLRARLTELAVLALRGDRSRGQPAERKDESWYRVANYVAELPSALHDAGALDDAARSVGLGRRRFTDLFREIAGESWRRRVLRLRLEHACRLLALTRRSVTAIAFDSGFAELSHFHHSFKAAHGCTPLEYRARHPA